MAQLVSYCYLTRLSKSANYKALCILPQFLGLPEQILILFLYKKKKVNRRYLKYISDTVSGNAT